MKNRRSFFAALAFVLAIGSAFASEYLIPQQGFTKRSEVPDGQTENCRPRETCDGIGAPCRMIVSNVLVNLYDGIPQTSTTCGTQLQENDD